MLVELLKQREKDGKISPLGSKVSSENAFLPSMGQSVILFLFLGIPLMAQCSLSTPDHFASSLLSPRDTLKSVVCMFST